MAFVHGDDVLKPGNGPEAPKLVIFRPVHRVLVAQACEIGTPTVGSVKFGVADINIRQCDGVGVRERHIHCAVLFFLLAGSRITPHWPGV